MKKRKIVNNKVLCPRENDLVPVKKCLDCEDVFGIMQGYVNCKRGYSKDEYLKKSGNIRSGKYAKNG